MKLVELIPALQTDPTVLATAREFAERMGKTVTQSADTPGTPPQPCVISFEYMIH
jgi:3-hydroxybutyryl-CoA dehydrogenase